MLPHLKISKTNTNKCSQTAIYLLIHMDNKICLVPQVYKMCVMEVFMENQVSEMLTKYSWDLKVGLNFINYLK